MHWLIRRGGRSGVPFAFAASAALAALGCDGKPSEPQVAPAPAAASAPATGDCATRDTVTFFVASDTHFGFSPEVEAKNEDVIRQMNEMAGKPWPEALGGTIGAACGILVTGDLTEDGKPDEWAKFVAAFGLKGNEGRARFPVYEMIGNHDKNTGNFVRDRVAERHGGSGVAARYAIEWGPVRLLTFGDAPNDEDLAWLDAEAARGDARKPLLLFFHYPLEGRWATGQWFGDGPHRDRLRERLEGKNVAGIFHGHDHAAGNYAWRGIDVYRTGSPKHSWNTIDVAEVGRDRMKVASWDYRAKAWVAWHAKPLGGEGATLRWQDPRLAP